MAEHLSLKKLIDLNIDECAIEREKSNGCGSGVRIDITDNVGNKKTTRRRVAKVERSRSISIKQHTIMHTKIITLQKNNIVGGYRIRTVKVFL